MKFVYCLAIILAAVVLASPVACTIHRQRVIGDAAEKGSDPIAMKCALETENSVSPMCILKAAGGGKQ